MASDDKSVAEVIERLTRASQAPIVGEFNGIPVSMQGGVVTRRDDLLKRPLIRKELVEIKTVDSFIDYTNHHINGNSALFSDFDSSKFGVIFDYEDAGGVLNQAHKARLTLENTLQYEKWSGKNDVGMSQEEFALFLEENASDIVDPDSASIIAVANELRATKDAEFESKVSLQNGSHVFSYKEEVRGTYQNGKTEVPKSFYIGIPIYRGQTDTYKLECKLRFRVSNGGLVLWYSIPLLDRAVLDAFNDVKAQIVAGVHDDPVVYEAKIAF